MIIWIDAHLPPAIASHQTQTKPNNRVGTKQSAIAIA